jgi:hypothetical protein
MAAKKSGKPVRPGGSSADLSKPIKSVTQAQKDMNRKPRGQMRTGGSEVVNMGGKKMIMDWNEKRPTKFKPVPEKRTKTTTVKPFVGATGRKPRPITGAMGKPKRSMPLGAKK